MNDHIAHMDQWRRDLAGAEPQRILEWASETFGESVAFATSLGVEDQVLTAMIARAELSIPIFTLDTGRLFPATYDLLGATSSHYGLPIGVYFPDAGDVEDMVRLHGVNLFHDSVSARKRCCEVRKVRPLRRALHGLDAWICGLRSGQGATRQAVEVVEWDAASELVKINPLASWSEEMVWAWAGAHGVPISPLHEQGFPSIGCAPCTRAVAPGDDPRSGRWWWEDAEHRECGLHQRNTGEVDTSGETR